MKKTHLRRLELNRMTLRGLTAAQLHAVAGGYAADEPAIAEEASGPIEFSKRVDGRCPVLLTIHYC